MLNIKNDFIEDENSYKFSNKSYFLEIKKDINMYKIEPLYENFEKNVVIEKEYAMDLAIEFLEKNNIVFNYEEAIITFDKNIFTVNFISRLGSLKNYSFPNKMIIDSSGNIKSFEYYFINYKKFASKNVKSSKDALLSLPTKFIFDANITLDNSELCYIYDDSIVQSVYRFTGNLLDGKSFECFVKASEY